MRIKTVLLLWGAELSGEGVVTGEIFAGWFLPALPKEGLFSKLLVEGNVEPESGGCWIVSITRGMFFTGAPIPPKAIVIVSNT